MPSIEFFFVIAFFSGVLIKHLDILEDKRKQRNYILAMLCAFLLIWVVSFSSLSSLWIGAIVAQIFAGKIDTRSHKLMIMLFSLLLLFFSVKDFMLVHAIIFFVFSFIDEFAPIRIFLPLSAFAVSLFTGYWNYLLAIVMFDFGYNVISFIPLVYDRGNRSS